MKANCPLGERALDAHRLQDERVGGDARVCAARTESSKDGKGSEHPFDGLVLQFTELRRQIGNQSE